MVIGKIKILCYYIMSSNNYESQHKWNIISFKDVGKILGGIIITGTVVSIIKYTWNSYNTSKNDIWQGLTKNCQRRSRSKDDFWR